MCFSAEASFIVSGTLFIIGTTTIRKTFYFRDFPVALIPLISATQQLAFTNLETFASVWCFFVAIASAFIYFYFAHRIKKPLISIS